MKINGYLTEWNQDEGLQRVELQDIVIAANAEEIRKLAAFLSELADQAERTAGSAKSIDFGDSKPNPKTGIKIFIDCKNS